MRLHTFAILAISILVTLALATSCNSSNNGQQPPKPILESGNGQGISHGPGTYCFAAKAGTTEIEAHLTLDAKAMAEGYIRGTKIDSIDSYVSNFNTNFQGSLSRDTLYLDVTSDQTGSREASKEKWLWQDKTLTQGKQPMQQKACE